MVTWLGTSSNAALAFDGISVTWPAVFSHSPDGGLAMWSDDVDVVTNSGLGESA